ncbi:MAG: serine/threonine protein kinase [Myxococcales bacterium]|nr:serine/threonine protein kinase [Myxococcales bacterium]
MTVKPDAPRAASPVAMAEAVDAVAATWPATKLLGARYRLLRPLAAGGMAELFLALQYARSGFEKLVVIRRLREKFLGDPRVIALFLDEARIGSWLNHPNIVQVFDVEEDEGVPFIAMEFIRGEELSRIARRGLELDQFLPPRMAVELIRQAASALAHVHEFRQPLPGGALGAALDIVHCDISPNNLMVTASGFLKVIDFGIARHRFSESGEATVLPGKLSYMSPEQARREAVDHRSDQFSLAVVLYELTVGRRLFRGQPDDVFARITEGKIAPPRDIDPEFPEELQDILMRALALAPSDRFASSAALAEALGDFLAASGSPVTNTMIAEYMTGLGYTEAALDYDVAATAAEPSWDEQRPSDASMARALGIDEALWKQLHTPPPSASLLGSGGDAHGELPIDTSEVPRRASVPLAVQAAAAAAIVDADDAHEARAGTGQGAALWFLALLGLVVLAVVMYWMV